MLYLRSGCIADQYFTDSVQFITMICLKLSSFLPETFVDTTCMSKTN